MRSPRTRQLVVATSRHLTSAPPPLPALLHTACSIGANDGCQRLAESLALNSRLTILNLKGNSLGDAGVEMIAAGMLKNNTLQSLTLNRASYVLLTPAPSPP